MILVCFVLVGVWVMYGIDGYVVKLIMDYYVVFNLLNKEVVCEVGVWLVNFNNMLILWVILVLGVVLLLLIILIVCMDKVVWVFVFFFLMLVCIILIVGIVMFLFVMLFSIMMNVSLIMWDVIFS